MTFEGRLLSTDKLKEELAMKAMPSSHPASIADVMVELLSYETPDVRWLRELSEQRQGERNAAGAFRARPLPDEARTRKEKVGARTRQIARLLVRDGDECWYCAKPLGDDMSLEHLKPRAHGGGDEDDNLVLAHERCNRAVGALPLAAKEAARAEMRKDKA